MAVRSVSAVAVAAAVVFVVVRERRLHQRLACERASSRLTAGCLHRDLSAFRVRLEAAVAAHEPASPDGVPSAPPGPPVPVDALSVPDLIDDSIHPPMEGGSR